MIRFFQNGKYIALFLILILVVFSFQNCTQQVGQSSKPIITFETKSGFEMVLINGGTFMMGNENGNEDESPPHEVTVSNFAMDKYEVTQKPYEEFMLADPSHFKAPDNPVEQVRWSDAADFCNVRSEAEGLEPCYDINTYECDFEASGYRLPTEAEWEYACRAGTNTDYDFSDNPQKLSIYAWYSENSNKRTHRVGTKKPNACGLFDMYGNVSEWCNDVYDENYYQNSPKINPLGPEEGKKRVIRGGSWKSSADACRASYRMADVPGITDACFARDTYGFRCVRRLSDDEIKALEDIGNE